MFRYYPVDTPALKFGEFSDAVALWQDKLSSNGLPSWSSFRVADFSGWHATMVFSDVLREEQDIRFRFFGSEITARQGSDFTGARLSAVAPVAYSQYYRGHLQRLFESPVIACGQIPVASGRPGLARVAVLYLPLADDGYTVNRLLHFFRWGSA